MSTLAFPKRKTIIDDKAYDDLYASYDTDLDNGELNYILDAEELEARQRPDGNKVLSIARIHEIAEEVHPNALVMNTNKYRFKRAFLVTGSTGMSQEKRKLVKHLKNKHLAPSARRVIQKQRTKSTGDCRRRVVNNAALHASARVHVLIDRAVENRVPMHMTTFTFRPDVKLKYVIDWMQRTVAIWRKRDLKDYVMVWGVGDKAYLEQFGEDEIEMSAVTRSRLHLHVHLFHLGEKSDFVKPFNRVARKDPRFSKEQSFVHTETYGHHRLEAYDYAGAHYAAANLNTFKPSELEDLVKRQIYNQDALKEFDRVRGDLKLYTACRTVNEELRSITDNEEVPVLCDIKQDAIGQTLLHINNENPEFIIEHANITASNDGATFTAKLDGSTVKSFKRVIRERYVPGNSLPYALYRAWTLSQEAGYQASAAFLTWVADNPAVEHELESKRLARHSQDDTELEVEYDE